MVDHLQIIFMFLLKTNLRSHDLEEKHHHTFRPQHHEWQLEVHVVSNQQLM